MQRAAVGGETQLRMFTDGSWTAGLGLTWHWGICGRAGSSG